jgi:hypothetical protein
VFDLIERMMNNIDRMEFTLNKISKTLNYKNSEQLEFQRLIDQIKANYLEKRSINDMECSLQLGVKNRSSFFSDAVHFLKRVLVDFETCIAQHAFKIEELSIQIHKNQIAFTETQNLLQNLEMENFNLSIEMWERQELIEHKHKAIDNKIVNCYENDIKKQDKREGSSLGNSEMRYNEFKIQKLENKLDSYLETIQQLKSEVIYHKSKVKRIKWENEQISNHLKILKMENAEINSYRSDLEKENLAQLEELLQTKTRVHQMFDAIKLLYQKIKQNSLKVAIKNNACLKEKTGITYDEVFNQICINNYELLISEISYSIDNLIESTKVNCKSLRKENVNLLEIIKKLELERELISLNSFKEQINNNDSNGIDRNKSNSQILLNKYIQVNSQEDVQFKVIEQTNTKKSLSPYTKKLQETKQELKQYCSELRNRNENQLQNEKNNSIMIEYLTTQKKESRERDENRQKNNLEELNGELLVYKQKIGEILEKVMKLELKEKQNYMNLQKIANLIRQLRDRFKIEVLQTHKIEAKNSFQEFVDFVLYDSCDEDEYSNSYSRIYKAILDYISEIEQAFFIQEIIMTSTA